jgi:hypothetical protein
LAVQIAGAYGVKWPGFRCSFVSIGTKKAGAVTEDDACSLKRCRGYFFFELMVFVWNETPPSLPTEIVSFFAINAAAVSDETS